MEDEIDDFINFDTDFIDRPPFYNKLTSSSRTMGDSVDEALSMSGEYLSDIDDIEGIFQTSAATCSKLSLQITHLANKMRDLSRDEIERLLDM